jgi:hypothetical protein
MEKLVMYVGLAKDTRVLGQKVDNSRVVLAIGHEGLHVILTREERLTLKAFLEESANEKGMKSGDVRRRITHHARLRMYRNLVKHF